ncbi:MAG: glycoside hydrolase family 88 protein [Polyangia bacterium]|nr:glycoside hydrolase family 88 protein [Polyangia bacterium]
MGPAGRALLAAVALVAGLALSTACPGPGESPLAWDFPDVCLEGQAPDEACYVEKRAPGSAEVALAAGLAARYMAEHPAELMAWDWGEGTLMFAMTELSRVTGDGTYLHYAKTWMDHHLASGYPLTWSDHCPPALTALALYEDTGDVAYRAVVEDVMYYLESEALRTEEGGISHMGTQDLFGPTLWLDSLFMFGMALTRWAEQTGDEGPLEVLGEQIGIFARALQTEGGLFYHAYQWPTAPDPDVFWARGNGWVTVAGYDYLRARRLRGERDRAVSELLGRQVAAVRETQDSTGLWWTVMDRPGEIYLETSAAALFGFGMARGYRYGLLGPEVLPSVGMALGGVRARILRDSQERPYVTGISGPTTAGSFTNYASVPLVDDRHFGVGAVMLFLIEASGLPLGQ